jgi:hypothetical protein
MGESERPDSAEEAQARLESERHHEEPEPPASGSFDTWRRRSATGSIGTAIARGLGDVFAPSEHPQVISAPAPGDPPNSDDPFRVVLDPDDPTKAVAIFAAPREAGADDSLATEDDDSGSS